MNLPTASELARYLKCPISWTLPRVLSEVSDNARQGTAAHEYCERIVSGMSSDDSLALVPAEFQYFCAHIAIEKLPIGVVVEPAFHLLPTGPELIGCNIGRKYPRSDVYRGTADLIILEADPIRVIDFKFGHVPITARDNWQLMFLGYSASKVYGAESVSVEIWQGVELAQDKHILDAWELEEIEKTLLTPPSNTVLPVEGSHCMYCPALRSCPAKIALLKTLSEGSPDLESYGKLKSAKHVLEKAWSDMRDLARSKSIDIGEGKMFGLHNGKIQEYKK